MENEGTLQFPDKKTTYGDHSCLRIKYNSGSLTNVIIPFRQIGHVEQLGNILEIYLLHDQKKYRLICEDEEYAENLTYIMASFIKD